jgi:hypothetical protein
MNVGCFWRCYQALPLAFGQRQFHTKGTLKVHEKQLVIKCFVQQRIRLVDLEGFEPSTS